MKRYVFLAMVAMLGLAVIGCKDKKPESSCVYGNDIPPDKMAPLLDLTDQMVMTLIRGEYKDLYDYSSQDLKRSQTRDQFIFAIEYFTKAFGTIDYPRVSELYYMTSKAKEPQAKISCNLGTPGVNDEYTMPANREMAVAIYDVVTEMEPARMIFQLEKEGDLWKLRTLQLAPKTIKKQNADYFHKKAIEFRGENHLHLAVLYYKTALLLHDLGFNVTEFTTLAIQQQMEQVKVDYMPMGEVQVWETDSKKSYKVYNLDTAYETGNLLVQINYQAPSLADHGRLEADARDLAVFLDRKFPEYRLGFDGIRVTAASEDPSELLMSYHTTFTFPQLDEFERESPAPKPEETEPTEEGTKPVEEGAKPTEEKPAPSAPEAPAPGAGSTAG